MSSHAIDRAQGHAFARRARWAIAVGALTIGTAGCEATFRPVSPGGWAYAEDDVLIRASVVPPDIWSYPRVFYGGTYVYLVDGVWYYPTSSGWMVFRREPLELSRERTRIAPREVAPRQRTPTYGYPR